MRKPRKYDNDIRSQFRKFVYRVACRLVDIVEKEEYVHNSTPRINRIVEAVITVMYIFRQRYRNLYKGVKHRIKQREKFIEFCKNFYQHEKLPYFFTFLLNIAMKFEMFLYLREEGHNYFAVFAHMIADDTNYFYFEAKGGAERLADTADYFLRMAKDLQLLVKSEDPLSEELLSLGEQLSEIDAENLDYSDQNSFNLLQNINKNLYSGLQQHSGKKVLPFIILRFILESRVPESTAVKTKKKIPVEKYFNRCLVPEIVNGEAFQHRVKSQLPTNDISESSWSRIRSARKKEKMNQLKKIKECEKLTLQAEPSVEDKTYGDGLEWLKPFDAKTLSLLNNDGSKRFEESFNPAEDRSSRKGCDPLKTATGTVNVGTKQKKSSNYKSTEEQSKQPVNSSYSKAKCHGSEVQKHKEANKPMKVKEVERRAPVELTDEMLKLRENLLCVMRRAKRMHCWEKRIIMCLIRESQSFSEDEIAYLHEKVRNIPDKDHVHPVKEADSKKFVEVIRLEVQCDSLYGENGQFLWKLPCPKYKGNVSDYFCELMIAVLALSCDDIIQVRMLHEWIPILQNFIKKNDALMLLLYNNSFNKLFQLLNNYIH